MGAVLGVVGGVLIKLIHSRVSGQRRGQSPPLSSDGRAALRVFLAAYAVIAMSLLGALMVIGGVESTVPYAVVAIVAGIALARVWSARAQP